MRALVREAGLERQIELDSAGTGGWHVGSAPDERATAAAAGRGIVLEGAARRVRAGDFDDFDLLIAMDSANRSELRGARRATTAAREGAAAARVRPGGRAVGRRSTCPTPTTARATASSAVLDLVEAACRGLLAQIRAGDAAVTLPPGARRRAAGGRRRHQRGVSRRARRRRRGVREDARGRGAGRVRGRGGGPAMAGASRARARAARCSRVDEATWRCSGSSRAGSACASGGPRSWRRGTRGRAVLRPRADAVRRGAGTRGAAAATTAWRGSARCGCRTRRRGTGRASTQSAACGRWRDWRASAARSARTAPRAVERVCERIDELAGPPEPPSRLHGDLWGGQRDGRRRRRSRG